MAPSHPKAGRGLHGVGWVKTQRVDLVALRVQLEVATGCRERPEPADQSSVLRRPQILAAQCRSSPFEGELPVYGVAHDGTRTPRLFSLAVTSGAVSLRFVDLEATLDAMEVPPGALASLELGEEAWAGTVQLERLEAFLARWHFHWVARGRGSAALFIAAHPAQSDQTQAGAMAVEAELARQERDYLDVGTGRLSARAFLERHLWSPYRASVRRMEDQQIRAAGP